MCFDIHSHWVHNDTHPAQKTIQHNLVTNYDQQEAMFLELFTSTDALHVSGGSSAHHQEHITVHMASGIVHQYCCLLVSRMRVPSHP